MTDENNRMKNWLKANGIEATPKYIKDGSMRGCWRLYNNKIAWWDNEPLWNKLMSLGFVDFDGDKLDKFSGNGGTFSIFPRLMDKYAEIQILHNTDDNSAIY